MARAPQLKPPSIPALALYAATLVLEVPVIFARMLVVLAVTALVLLVKDGSPAGASAHVDLALIPTAWSALALVTPLCGGWWWKQTMGAREPSGRERGAYQAAVDLLARDCSGPLQMPSSWTVIDTPHPDAAVCGNSLLLSRGLLESEYLPAVLAHELGHLHSSDGKLTAALGRLVVRRPARTREREPRERTATVLADEHFVLTITLVGALLWVLRRTVSFAKGGFALRLLAPLWGSYWREREYLADQYAAGLGQAHELADFLELHTLVHDQPVPFIWLTEHTHPPTELRIDRLHRAAPAPSETADADLCRFSQPRAAR